MDLTKLGPKTWSEPGAVPLAADAVAGFRLDVSASTSSLPHAAGDNTSSSPMTNTIGDLLQMSRSRSQRHFVNSSAAASPADGPGFGSAKVGFNVGASDSKTKKQPASSTKKRVMDATVSVYERPATRAEIEALGTELQERVAAVMDSSSDDRARAFGASGMMAYDPNRDAVALLKERVLKEMDQGVQAIAASSRATWIADMIQCECLRLVCDETALKFTDMLAVSSCEFGAVMRRLRSAYQLSHDRLRVSWKDLSDNLCAIRNELIASKETIRSLEGAMDEKEHDIRQRIDSEVAQMREAYEQERAKDREHVVKLETQMAEMSTTLRDLNSLFKAMQADAELSMATDTVAKCRTLENEVKDLEAKVATLTKIKDEYTSEQKRYRVMDATLLEQSNELDLMRATVARQEEAIANLMGREAMHNAEIDRLKKIAANSAEKEEQVDFDQSSTALLCIKCKKSLDDLSNIRDAVLGTVKTQERLMCQNFRILLPNLKGRRPSRDISWLRRCMRAILTSKMREVVNLSPIGVVGHVSGFPEYVYGWFDPVLAAPVAGSTSVITSKGAAASAAAVRADEDRWGLYYGVKGLSRENLEAKLFWSLLDEAQGEDGLVFVMYCISVALTLGGEELWRQFGDCTGYDSFSSLRDMQTSSSRVFAAGGESKDTRRIPPTVWLRLDVAKEGARHVLTRALEAQLHETLEAIDALKEHPGVENPLVPEFDEPQDATQAASAPVDKTPKTVEPTHIDLFAWLSIFLQRYQEEQSHRVAAIQLMFDTASVGGMVAAPPQPTTGDGRTPTDSIPTAGTESVVLSTLGNNGTGGVSPVEFPQFVSIMKTLYPSIATTEIASIFAQCYDRGDRKVTASVFIKVADTVRLFSRIMKLAPLPLLRIKPSDRDAKKHNDSFGGGAVSDQGAETTEAKAEEEFISPGSPLFSSDQEQSVRIHMGAFIHSRAKLIEPEVYKLSRDLPERWRNMLLDLFLELKHSINDGFARVKAVSKQKQEEAVAVHRYGGAKNLAVKPLQSYCDGLRTYMLYKRLLALMLLLKTLSDNPLLPGDLLLPSSRSSASGQKGLTRGGPDGSVPLSFVRAKAQMTQIENAIIGTSFESSKLGKFEQVRKSIGARRIQALYMKFVSSQDVPVPPSIRCTMRCGYLSGRPPRGTDEILKKRRVGMDPWCAHALVAEIYFFKLCYDRRARIAGTSTIDLHKAVLASQVHLWGCIELAEITTHDLCFTVKTFMHAIPRLKLFAAFLGFSELDQAYAPFLAHKTAPLRYLELVCCIHKVINTCDPDEEVFGETGAILFPSQENPILRSDKRDFWKCSPAIFKDALSIWAGNQSSVALPLYLKSLERLSLSADREGLLDVDDFLYIIMMQWAKIASTCVARSEIELKKYSWAQDVVFTNQYIAKKNSNLVDSHGEQKEKAIIQRQKPRVQEFPPSSYDLSGVLGSAVSFAANSSSDTMWRFESPATSDVIVSLITNRSEHKVSDLHSYMLGKLVPPAGAKDDAVYNSLGPLTEIKALKSTDSRYEDIVIIELNAPDTKSQAKQTLGALESANAKSSGAIEEEERQASRGNRVHEAFYDLSLSGAVAPMVSTWIMTRLWSPLQPAAKKFLDEAKQILKDHSESLGPPPSDLNVTAARQGVRSKAVVAAESDLLRAHKTVQSLLQLIKDSDDAMLFLMRASGGSDVKTASFAVPRGQSSVAEAQAANSDEQGVNQCWSAWQVLFASITKLSMYTGLKFPFDSASNKISTRKIQLDRTNVYFHQAEGPPPPPAKVL